MFQVYFENEKKTVQVPAGTTVLEAEIRAGLTPDAPCGGQGTCKKCQVSVNGQLLRACQTRIQGDIKVKTPQSGAPRAHSILTEGLSRPLAFQPSLHVREVFLEKALPGEKQSDYERLLHGLFLSGGPLPQRIRPNLSLASSLYGLLAKSRRLYVVHTEDEILELSLEEPHVYFAAFDIGTTTVVAYLLDGQDGRQIAVESCLNPQSQYGADVIMRSHYALEHGTEALSSCIRQAADQLLARLAKKAGISVRDICQVSIAGNTCMHHLFLGLSPASLVHAPYTPAFRESLTLMASDYGLNLHPSAQLLMLPNIAGYVGADTCGCLMALRPDHKEDITLLLDIGTNGEMVLGNKDRLVTCSTAAGPAFEGAKIQCGMRGSSGAVDHVTFQDGAWEYTTVDHQPALGLCGSGLIDLVAQLLLHGFLDESGHLSSGQEDPSVFYLVPPGQAGCPQGVYITQKDIREVQLAKAAIAAGITLLMEELSITEEEISCLYIAGAFGNYMDPASAGAIGMFPKGLADKVQPVGNAAGEGAKIALLNHLEFSDANELAKSMDFMELATSPSFQDCFVDHLEF
ncbi:MAG: ASKHA domain-containing protein [Eubacteriales bacterium]|nr:ASKHA domain-containing protein [Eubacteriales bacterium]